jgi:hypothetical protein
MVRRDGEDQDEDSEDSDSAIIRKASVSAMNNMHLSTSLPQNGGPVEIDNIFEGSARDAYDRVDNGSDYSETNIVKLQSSQDSRSLASSQKFKQA